MPVSDVRGVVDECAANAGVELDNATVTAVLTILDYTHLLNDPWERGFTGTPAAWVKRIQRVARESLAAVVGSNREPPTVR